MPVNRAVTDLPPSPLTVCTGGHTSTREPLSEDPAQSIEDIRRRSFAVLQPICSTLLTHHNDPIELTKLLLKLKQALLGLQPAGVESCVDYVIFPLQVALDAIAYTRTGSAGGGDGGTVSTEQSFPSSSATATNSTPTSKTTARIAAFPALKSDKAAEALLSVLLIVLQKGTKCTGGDQLSSLLHRLCGILAVPRESVSEEIRLGTLKVVTAALVNVPYDQALQFSVREESSAPLRGHLGSVLVKAAAAELEAGSSGSTGSKLIRIEALRALKLLIQAVNDADALSFFLPGLMTGLARALVAAGGGRGQPPGTRLPSQGPAASGAATVEALQGLTCLLHATLGNESVRDLFLVDEDIEAVSTADVVGAGAAATTAAIGQAFSHWDTLRGDAALAELFKISNKKGHSVQEKKEEENTLDYDGLTHTRTRASRKSQSLPHPEPSTPPQSGEAPKLRVDRTEAWVRSSAARIEEMLGTILPPLASNPRPDVREALVHACATLSITCSLALFECMPVLTDIILALAQDSWPAVASAARSWLTPETAPSISAAALDNSSVLVPSSSSLSTSSIPILATAERSLKTWIHDLPAALRRGDEAGKAQALKITTCLEACPPHWITNHLLSHSTEVARLIHVLAACFDVDADSAGLLLVAAPEAAGASSFTTTSTTTTSSSSAASLSSSVSVSLPRMPLGLQYISTQKTYECVANLMRTLAAVAVTADTNKERKKTSGTALRSLIDGCVQHIQRLVDSSSASQEKGRKGRESRPGAGIKKNKKDHALSSPVNADGTYDFPIDAVLGNSISWTISAAQVVFVLTEIVFGASPAWQPKYTHLSAAAAAASSSSSSSSSTKELEALIALVLPELVDSRIWSLPTATTSSLSPNNDGHNNNYSAPAPAAVLPSSSPGFTSKDRGSNALLQRAILDCIGTSACALGVQFTSNGRLVRSILLPVVQKSGDPCRTVAASADTAIQAICTFCGYSNSTTGGLRQLVADNADYIVDGLCRQLRQPEKNPLAPQLFAALLRQGGVAPGLVPLLAEPARQALLGISIIARKKKPEHVLSFVLCLREIARGAGLVAKETCVDLKSFAGLVEERRQLLLEKIKDHKEKEKLSSKIGVVEEIVEPETVERDSSSIDSTKMEEIHKYFEDYRTRKQRTGGPSTTTTTSPDDDDGIQDVENDLKIPVLLEEWNQIQISHRKAASCATLAQSASDTASPLILSSALPVAIQSIRTCSEALEALKYASRGVEICAKQIDPVVIPPGGVVGPGPDPTSAAFLPSVHLFWSPLMGALRDWRVAVVESVLLMLSHVSQLAGSFLTRRFSEEAWPVMQRLLLEGPCQKKIIAPGQDDISSPAVIQRAQRAVLACLRTMATGGQGPEAILSPVAGEALAVTANLMGEKYPAVIREHATTAFVALSGIDPDAAWGLLVAAIRCSHSAAATRGKISTEVVVEDNAGGVHSLWCPAGLPSMAEICPAPPTSATAEKFVPKGLQTCGETKLLALMREVNEMPVHWHSDVEKILIN